MLFLRYGNDPDHFNRVRRCFEIHTAPLAISQNIF
jgi:hypothetical protein